MQKQRLNIEIGEKEAEGIYANLVLIAHSPTEIILDFARVMPGAQKTKIQARVIMTPVHAKLLHKTLGENLKKFEEKNGEIKMPGGMDSMMGKNIGFESSHSEPEENK
jgi:hypothetical protein